MSENLRGGFFWTHCIQCGLLE